jgi:hypothetical protein
MLQKYIVYSFGVEMYMLRCVEILIQLPPRYKEA